MTDNDILLIIENSKYSNFRSSIYDKIFSENEKEYLKNRFEVFKSYKETIYRIKHNIEYQPICPVCGKEIKFNKGYSKTCSHTCSNKLINSIDTLNKKVKEKYNVDNVWQSDIIKEKCKQQHLKNYGVDNVSKSEIIKNKKKQTCLKNFGVKAGFNNGKAEITKLNRYGLSTYNNIKKAKETKKKKYGSENYFNHEKYKQTMLTRYGVENCAQLYKTIKNSHSSEAIKKCWETQKKNGTINKSKEEDKTYELLMKKFNTVIRQYFDVNRYPFYCDFYIPDLDLFIECQYGMFHNNRPYLGTEEDLKEIEILKQKSIKRKQQNGNKKTRYDSLINIWSIHDPKKRNIAKENNLNYLEFFTILEFEKWLNEYETTKQYN